MAALVGLQAIEKALVSAASTVVGATILERENNYFAKPTDSKWARVTFMPNRPSVETLGPLGEDMVDGLLQVDYFYPAGKGNEDSGTDCEALRAAFVAGKQLSADSQNVVIKSCGRGTGRKEDNWYAVSVTIEWYALVARTAIT